MPVLIDYSQVFIGNFMQVAKTEKPDEDLVRHIVLNSIRNYNKIYGKEYGEIVLCCDYYATWRKQIFPHYKASRKKGREKHEKAFVAGETIYSWDELFKSLNKVRNEIKEHLPYVVMYIENCEADDIIGTLCKYTQTEDLIPPGKKSLFEEKQPVLIISSDKDFIQLHNYDNVKQFSPLTKKFLSHNNPIDYLLEHILRGDRGDGIPNILSENDCFVSGKRQIPVTKKKITTWKNNLNGMSHKERVGFDRNETLIDLKKIPQNIQMNIVNEWKTTDQCKNRKELLNYFIKYRLKNLINVIEEF